MKRTAGPSRRSSLKRSRPRRVSKGISPASPAQREKVKGQPCLNCGLEARDGMVIDPAHLCARSLGGCDHEDCVVPLCRTMFGLGCHRMFDDGHIDLAPKLEPRFRREVAHCVEHLGLYGALRRISGRNPNREEAA